ncbi:uncharacterized protein [Dermacentor albipictus]|uniref:uncharacterized protein isoform X5 n=1 Tax=Dermacentor albipictus TaxID=60249 RepID=UPI0031FD8663
MAADAAVAPPDRVPISAEGSSDTEAHRQRGDARFHLGQQQTGTLHGAGDEHLAPAHQLHTFRRPLYAAHRRRVWPTNGSRDVTACSGSIPPPPYPAS